MKPTRYVTELSYAQGIGRFVAAVRPPEGNFFLVGLNEAAPRLETAMSEFCDGLM